MVVCVFSFRIFKIFYDIENLVIFSKFVQVTLKEQKHSIFSQFFFRKKTTQYLLGEKPFFLSMDFILFYFMLVL
jgi:hypothetical protein